MSAGVGTPERTLTCEERPSKVAELIGYGRVVQIARQMGLGNNIRATPAVALGAYEMTPVEVAAGYTTFATGGTRAERHGRRGASQMELNGG